MDCGISQSRAGELSPPDLPFRLTGSQAKTAFAIRANCEAMIAGSGKRRLVPESRIEITNDAGEREEKFIPAHFVCDEPEFLNATGFLTLTVGDQVGGKFQQVFDAAEASKRFNNINRRLLKKLFIRAIVVSERHKNGAIHFHLVGVLRGCPDIRSGFDFKAFDAAKKARAKNRINTGAEIRYKMAASPALSAFWKMLREELPKHGFGRAELTPIIKTGEAVACYVSKYIEKNICNRLAADKRKKLVRYIGDWKTTKAFKKEEREKLIELGVLPALETDYVQTMTGRRLAAPGSAAPHKVRPNDFAWASKRAVAWRGKAAATAALICCDSPADCAFALGPRWAFHLSKVWQGRTVDDLQPFLVADTWQLDAMRGDLENIVARYRPKNLGKLALARWGHEVVKADFVGDVHNYLNSEIRREFKSEADFAEFFDEYLPLITRKEGPIERFLRISERYQREEDAWQKLDEIEKQRAAAILN